MMVRHAEKHLDKIKFPKGVGDHTMIRGKYTKIAYGRLQKNWQNAEDAVQQTYLKILENPTSIEMSEDEYEAFYRVILMCTINDSFRSEKRREVNHVRDDKWLQYLEQSVEEEANNEHVHLGDEDSSAESQALAQELYKWTVVEIDRLKPNAKNIVYLSVVYGYKPREICMITGDTTIHIANTLYYFRRTMKEKMNEYR